MAEITYQMVLSTLQTVALIVGISYYIMVLRNQQKSQKHAEETRKIQLLNEANQYMREPNSNTRFHNMMSMEWENYEDFTTKYGQEKNPEYYEEWTNLWRRIDFSGNLIKDGLIDTSTYVRYMSDYSPIMWSKFKPIIDQMRILQDNPEMYIGIETLAKEVDKYRVSKGLKPKAPT